MSSTEGDRAGLSESEAASRLKAEGANELPAARRRSWIGIVAHVIREPMFGLLLGAGLVYLALGDLVEALVLLVFATASVSIAVVQETRSERVLDALRDLTSPRALVVRDGQQRRIPGRDVVRGDLLLLVEGDRVPADARFISEGLLRVDESLLTGEAAPVTKAASKGAEVAARRPGGEGGPWLFSGTLVVAGTGAAVVMATGKHSEIGRIGTALAEIETATPRLQEQTRRFVQGFAAAALGFAVAAALLYGILRGGWLDAVLGGIALGMSMLPEEFPLVLTAFMVMGAWRISRANVLTRRTSAIETLGSATLLCTDKTGTLTQNRMTVACLETPDDRWWAQEGPCLALPLQALLDAAVLASMPDPVDRSEEHTSELQSH